jgi:hypothetical protein
VISTSLHSPRQRRPCNDDDSTRRTETEIDNGVSRVESFEVYEGAGTRACRQLSQQSAATMWHAARKFRAVLS